VQDRSAAEAEERSQLISKIKELKVIADECESLAAKINQEKLATSVSIRVLTFVSTSILACSF